MLSQCNLTHFFSTKILVENLSKLKKLMFPVIRLTWTNSNWHAWHLAVDDNLDQVDLAASEYYSEGHLYRKDGLPIKMDSFYSEIWHPIHSYLL